MLFFMLFHWYLLRLYVVLRSPLFVENSIIKFDLFILFFFCAADVYFHNEGTVSKFTDDLTVDEKQGSSKPSVADR